MALMLAPYNEAMRIGMGFNSYTQTLCIDDCVRHKDGSKASETSLKAQDPSVGVAGTVVKTVGHGQVDISQVVSWNAGFVDKVSDLNHSLNISGALTITVDALNASASASAHYLNETSTQNSDVQYSIIVKVTNQKLVADDVTLFTPIDNVPESKFQEVYGDCFISGFLEGGVLNGLISKKLLKERDNTEIGGAISLQMQLKVASVKGEAKGEYKNQSLSDTTETIVNVSWSGGGDIKPDNVRDWDIPNLTSVAVDFPNRVAFCPQRTYAILTKYTALRSYYEKTVKGSPMDYEIAGIYTNALLDSYMQYKSMWAELQDTIKQMSLGKTAVHKRPESDQLVKYRVAPQKDYEERMEKFNAAKDALVKSGVQSQVVLEKPLPANACVPYDANDFGLDVAQRDCRYEMIKIVREVNDVTWNPKAATDANRNWRYLSPAIFRLLLPTDKQPMPTPEEIQKMRTDLQAEIDKNVILAKEKADAAAAAEATSKDLTSKLQSAQTERDTAKDANAKAEGKLDQLSKDFTALTTSLDARGSVGDKSSAGDKLTVIRIEYGRRNLRPDPAVYARVLHDILAKSNITINNEYFGGDPLPGQVKTALITYQWKDHVPVNVEGTEGTTLTLGEGQSFDALYPSH